MVNTRQHSLLIKDSFPGCRNNQTDVRKIIQFDY